MRERNFVMNRKNRILLLIVELPLIVAVSLGLWFVYNGPPREIVSSDTGIWDLRSIDFSRAIVRFDGKVEFFAGALLTPDEFARSTDEIEIIDARNTGSRYGTSRIRILVPEDASYAVSGNSPLGAVRIFINGEWMDDIGLPGESAESAVPSGAFFYYTVRPRGGVIEIVQQVSNFAHRLNETHAGYVIGSVRLVRSFAAREVNVTAFVMGCFLALCFVHLTLWFLLRRYRINLYFSLLCLVWAIRTAVVERNPLLDMFPGIIWQTTFRLDYATVPLTIILSTLIMDRLFPAVMTRLYKVTAYLTAAVFAILSLFMQTAKLSAGLVWYEAMLMLMLVWYIALLILWFHKNAKITLTQAIYLVGWAIFTFACVRDILYQNEIYIWPCGDGTIAEISLVLFAFFQTVAMSLGTMREMDEAMAREQRLASENASLDRLNKLRADLMDTLSHELRTPLAVMMGFAELAVKELRLKGLDNETTADLDAIAAEAGRLAAIVSDARQLSLSRDAAEHRGELSIETIIGQTARLYRPILQRSATSLTLDIEENLPPVFGSADELTQVMFNLLTNAGKHTRGGEVRVTARRVDKDASGGKIEVTVADTGTGVSPDFLPRAFERYAHDDPNGVGLGLAICMEIVTAHGGEITLESEPGRETRAIFTLPAHEKK
jgi:signal transduction histidine kinase